MTHSTGKGVYREGEGGLDDEMPEGWKNRKAEGRMECKGRKGKWKKWSLVSIRCCEPRRPNYEDKK